MKVYHFHNGAGGGVLSVIKNLCRYSNNSNIENHIIYVININEISNYSIFPIKGAISQQLFYYNPKNNFFYTCKQLSKLLPDNRALIIAHDWVELGMVSNLGLQNPVVYVLHGDFNYYYELAKLNLSVISAHVCISPKIFQNIKKIIPLAINNIHHQKFPVPEVKFKNQNSNTKFRLIYYVRDLNEDRKQFNIIVKIAEVLSSFSEDYFFTIAGGGMSSSRFFEIWPEKMKNNVNFLKCFPNSGILEILCDQDVFLLPSTEEGYPVSLVEAMKAGVVPLVTDWDGAVNDLIIEDITGYYLKIGDYNGYADRIKDLNNNKQKLSLLSKKCRIKACELFNPIENTIQFESILEIVSKKIKIKNLPLKVYGSRLDSKFIPNFITFLYRNFK